MSSGQLSLCCQCTPVSEATYDGRGEGSPLEAVVDALAGAKGVDPLELEPLHRNVDVDALENLFSRSAGDGEPEHLVLSFTVDGWNVFARSDGRVVVCNPDRPTDPSPVFDGRDRETRALD